MTLRTFSSILPFTSRFGVRGVTCMTNSAQGGGGGTIPPSKKTKTYPRTYLDLAEEVLKQIKRPLTYQEIWDYGGTLSMPGEQVPLAVKLGVKAKEPHFSLGSHLYTDSMKEGSKFQRVGARPVRFYLEGEPPRAPVPDEAKRLKVADSSSVWYTEADLHPILAHVAYANPKFGQGKNVRTKTITHQKGKGRKGFSEWTFPDMVGVWLPDWNDTLVAFGKKISGDLPLLFSFELKKEIDPGTYRESFFQAVSNSSWANEGYLVAAEIKNDDQLLAELRRLSTSFGVGVIRLNVDDPAASEILYPAAPKPRLDWETMNKLCEESDDFREFLNLVRGEFEAGPKTAGYDEVEDIDALLKQRKNASAEKKREKASKNKRAKKA